MAAIFFVSGDPTPPMPAKLSDKTLHLIAYGGLAVLACRALARGLPARITWSLALATLGITIGYAITDELHQRVVPGRSADVYDVMADAAGACLALIVLKCWDILGTPKSRLPTPNTQ